MHKSRVWSQPLAPSSVQDRYKSARTKLGYIIPSLVGRLGGRGLGPCAERPHQASRGASFGRPGRARGWRAPRREGRRHIWRKQEGSKWSNFGKKILHLHTVIVTPRTERSPPFPRSIAQPRSCFKKVKYVEAGTLFFFVSRKVSDTWHISWSNFLASFGRKWSTSRS